MTDQLDASAPVEELRRQLAEEGEQQKATSAVLRTIGQARGDARPVLQTIVDSALRLCAADAVGFFRREADETILVATAGEWPEGREVGSRRSIERQGLVGLAFTKLQAFHTADMLGDATRLLIRPDLSAAEWAKAFDLGVNTHRSRLAVPVIRDGEAIGVLRLQRKVPGGFTARQIELIETFAAQAAIAIENVRLFNETKEALEQQTAISEILRVISRSPTDVRPVLEAVVESAVRLSGAENGSVVRIENGVGSIVASIGMTEEIEAFQREFYRTRPLAPGRSSLTGRVLLERGSVQVPDVRADPDYEPPRGLDTPRSLLGVPLLRSDEIIGVIIVRRAAPNAFSARQVQLVEAFAAQAVIAIENVRLFTETKTSLEQQTATAQVLKTISRSAFDLQPVLATLMENAARLCRADVAWMTSRLPGQQRLRADYGLSQAERDEVARLLRDMTEPPRFGVMNRIYAEGARIHIADITTDPEAHAASHVVRAMRGRTVLAVPVRRENTVVAGFVLLRRDVRPFGDREIELVETFADQAAIAIENVRLFNETKEALEQQTATAEVLKVISRSAFDLQAVLDTLAENAVNLCEAEHCDVVHYDGRVYRDTAHFGVAADRYRELVERTEYAPSRGTLIGRTVLERRPVHVVDVLADPEYEFSEAQELGGFRSILGVPIMREGFPIGAISVWRREVRPFTDRQVQLLQTFADQAAIAMENVRLFNETKEALEQQTAIGEILRVIASSPASLDPVFAAIATSSAQLCHAERCLIWLRHGDVFRAAHGSMIGEQVLPHERILSLTLAPDRSNIPGRVLLEGAPVQIVDIQNDTELRNDFKVGNPSRSALGVPLRKGGNVLGVVVILRERLGAFTSREIAIVETFADQAAIAIENVRLFNETKEALEQRTAVADVLGVISRSPTDIQPVLDAVAESAARLLRANDVVIVRRDGDEVIGVAHVGDVPLRADHGQRQRLDRGMVSHRAIIDARPIHVPDLLAAADEFPTAAELARSTGQRTSLAVPLLREGSAIGSILIRRTEPRPFTDQEIALLQTFADQAAIAIENVRLFNETKEALERQTAVAGILRAISESPTDVQPVLDAIAESAARFCSAEDAAVILVDGDKLRTRAHHGPVPVRTQLAMEFPLTRGTVTGRSIVDRRTLQVPDLQAEPDDEYPIGKEQARRMGHRTTLASPLLREGAAIGAILLRRLEVRPFTDHQLDLVRTFADQAVIAIENVRLFNETKDALARQTAVAEVLGTISRSVFDLNPILTTVIQNAVQLCGAKGGLIFRRHGEDYRLEAMYGGHPAFIEYFRERVLHPGRQAVTMRAVTVGEPVQIADVEADPDYEHTAVREFEPFRTVLGIPLLHQGKPIGAMSLWRNEVRPFSEPEIDLVRTFADQAAIAIENVRLFNETKEALDRQTATSEILRVMAQSPTDVQPVLDAIAENATRVCGASDAHVYRVDGNVIRQWAHFGPYPSLGPDESLPLDRGSIAARSILEGRAIYFEDALTQMDPADYPVSAQLQKRWGYRTVLAVPLIRQDVRVGAIVIRRMEVQPFTEKQIELLETFARQAVIAIDNVRLFNETKESLERRTATSQVLEVISRSAFDLSPVLATVVERAATLADADHATIVLADAGEYEFAAYSGSSALLGTLVGQRSPQFRPKPWTKAAIDELRTIHIEDVAPIDPDPGPGRFSAQAETRTRTLLVVPLVKDAHAVGALLLQRERVEKFAPHQVEIVETFAKQATIAIENARLFNEIQDKSRQLEVASRHKSEFLANMSHELRTPLNAIIGFTDVMLEEMFGPLNEKQKEYLDDVRSSGTHLLTLINDILDLSKIEAGRVELEVTEFSFPDALENALTLVRERAARHGITIAPEVAADVGTIMADERKVKQILVNLLSNAVKFTPDGGWVGVSVRRADSQIQVAVRDTGIGIAPEDQERIFEEFQQVGRDPDKAREGTGLGLTLAKRFVELHSGRIWVESEVGKGSTFTFAIPVRQPVPVRT